MLAEELKEFARAGNFATLTTLLSDGRPAAQVMWVDCDDEYILLNTELHRKKVSSVENDPRVTVCIWARSDPYTYREIRGDVVEIIRGQEARDHIDELAIRYFGRPYDASIIASERVILKVAPLAVRPDTSA